MIDSLPAELLSQIAADVSSSDLLALSATSKSLRKTALDQRLWHTALESRDVYDRHRNYLEDYAWRHGTLAVHIQSELVPRDEELFKVMSFFPMHRSYRGDELAALSPEYLPWATSQLVSIPDNILILSCRKNDLVAHIYRDSEPNRGPRHDLLLLRNSREMTWLQGLPDWPLCASFIDDEHVFVCGRFPAALLYHVDRPDEPVGVPLSSHTINCLSFDDSRVTQRILICGHYKGRGSMEMLGYSTTADGDMQLEVKQQNKFAGVTAIVSCSFLPGGSFVTYDNYSHIYLWSSLWNATRKIDHDGIGDEIPSDMIYKMFYTDRQLVFIDQYKRQYAFTIRPGRQVTKETASSTDEGMSTDRAAEEEMKHLLFRQGNDMASLTRRILGI